MHRAPLLSLLDRYAQRHAEEPVVERFRAFVRQHSDCLERSCIPGHITASSWILSPDGSRALLTHHRKLGRWLQLGGHVDGEPQLARAALREAQEESGISSFEFLDGADLDPLDLDVHTIPARGSEPQHEHWDVRFLLRAATEAIQISDESNDLRWFTPEELSRVTSEQSVLRLPAKSAVRVRS